LVLEKKSVFKLIKSSSAELLDLSQLKDPDLESSICVARKVVVLLGVMSSTSLFEWKLSGCVV
jgi:hypothetical protein